MARFEKVSKYNEVDINLPHRKTSQSAGYDFEVAEDIIIPAYVEYVDENFSESDTSAYSMIYLNDDSYLANYAREHFLYSKDGEYILQIDDIEKIEDDITFEINKTYVIIGLSLLMFFIFVYILSKGARKKVK